jgi:hypothetical protein
MRSETHEFRKAVDRALQPNDLGSLREPAGSFHAARLRHERGYRMAASAPFNLAIIAAFSALFGACDHSPGEGPAQWETDEDSSDALDADGDTIMDIQEGEPTDDADADGTPNYLDTDSDGDGIKDRVEAGDGDPYTMPVDTDGDVLPDFLDADSDDDGVNDATEHGGGSTPADTDGDGICDFRDTDDDGDGILTRTENSTADGVTDHDRDGTPDYLDIDSDDDGCDDVYEAGTTEFDTAPVDTDGDGTPDYLDNDSDGDGFSDAVECGGSGAPRDIDADGHYDFQDTDSDGDGLDDDEEPGIGTDPYDADTDGDGQSDGAELLAGTDPLDPTSVIEGVYVVVPERSDVEEEFDFDLSVQKADIAFLIDTTCSMAGAANAMAEQFVNIVSELNATIEDAAYGYAHHEDYNTYPMGSGYDKPFVLQQQITTDVSLVQNQLDSTTIHVGDDLSEADYEAIYQGASGMGYDMDCDGLYDSEDDVFPFIASPDDPFGGTGGEWTVPETPGGGTIGGYGFRLHAIPFMVHAGDSPFRNGCTGSLEPGGCPQDACDTDAIAALLDIGARYIGIDPGAEEAVPDMENIAARTNSYADTDGDGVADDLLVYPWAGDNAEFRELIVDAITEFVDAITFDRIELQIDGDDYGFVTGIEPAYYDDIDGPIAGSTLPFTLYFRGVVAATTEDQEFILTLNVIGDGTSVLDTKDIVVVVPGSNY